jgi:hypothetical protein
MIKGTAQDCMGDPGGILKDNKNGPQSFNTSVVALAHHLKPEWHCVNYTDYCEITLTTVYLYTGTPKYSHDPPPSEN